MLRRSGLLHILLLLVLLAFWGCATGVSRGDPQGWGVRGIDLKADRSEGEQQLAALVMQLTADFPAHGVQRIAVLPFESTTGLNTDPLGPYLSEKLNHLLYTSRTVAVVERTFLNKVINEIERGYSGRFDARSLKEIGHLLHADTLVFGSYARLTGGITEIMARAVSVETGEIVGAGSATISSSIVPNIPIRERPPVLVKREPLPSEPMAGRAPQEGESRGTYNIVASPPVVVAYSRPVVSYSRPQAFYPLPPVVVAYVPARVSRYPSYIVPYPQRSLPHFRHHRRRR